MPLGMALAASAMFLLTLLGAHSSYAAHVLPPALLIMGLGFGLIFLHRDPTWPRPASATRMPASASAAVNTMQQVGGSVGNRAPQHRRPRAPAASYYLIGKDARNSAVL